MLSVTKMVGPEGGAIEVGGCVVTFPVNSLTELTKVTAVSEVDSRKWASSLGQVITPSLNVDIERLEVAANVKLPTWATYCHKTNTEGPPVQVLHFSKELDRWEVIHECRLGDTRSIEFECKSFSPLIAFLCWTGFLSTSFSFQSAVYSWHNEFIVVLHLDDETVEQGVRKRIRELRGNFEKVSFSLLSCEESDVLESQISVSYPELGFTFSPFGPFTCAVYNVLTNRQPSFSQCALTSQVPDTVDLKILFKVLNNGSFCFENGFSHIWKPGWDVS